MSDSVLLRLNCHVTHNSKLSMLHLLSISLSLYLSEASHTPCFYYTLVCSHVTHGPNLYLRILGNHAKAQQPFACFTESLDGLFALLLVFGSRLYVKGQSGESQGRNTDFPALVTFLVPDFLTFRCTKLLTVSTQNDSFPPSTFAGGRRLFVT